MPKACLSRTRDFREVLMRYANPVFSEGISSSLFPWRRWMRILEDGIGNCQRWMEARAVDSRWYVPLFVDCNTSPREYVCQRIPICPFFLSPTPLPRGQAIPPSLN
ncbi:hypothetical protein GSI_12973 [Ganoderma sinense ZZ0214-1]|uniref:Uncharacterized protein n=1 Tax=Ganoderma sinense ZZ0214-1 TaxID=1077348 RepID=A0A2G8RUC9_9APHY|nr:hypothetical protein GSI_12973 [Ganoderma sinense ZZ0214-1]